MFTPQTATHTTTSTESLAELLSDPHCRHLLFFLRASDGPKTVSTASRHIVGEMTDVPVEQVPGNVERRVQTWLHHGLLPTLADRGIVDFDPEARSVTLTDNVVVPSVEDRPRRREDVDSASDCSNS